MVWYSTETVMALHRVRMEEMRRVPRRHRSIERNRRSTRRLSSPQPAVAR